MFFGVIHPLYITSCGGNLVYLCGGQWKRLQEGYVLAALFESAPSAASATAEGTASTAAKRAATPERTAAAPEGATASETARAAGASTAEPAAGTGTAEGGGGAMSRPSTHGSTATHRTPTHGRVRVVVMMVMGTRGEHPEGTVHVVGAVVAAPILAVPGALPQGQHHKYQQEDD